MKKTHPVRENNPESPLVPGAPVRLLSRIPASQLITDWKKSMGIDIAGLLGGIPEILLYRCQASQVDFFLPPEAAGTPEFYEELRKFDWYYLAGKWEFNEALRDLAGRQRILEVGSGTGFFVEMAGRELKGAKVQGIEFNENAVSQAREKELPVVQMDLDELGRRGETFDAVCGFQVLEHVHHPRELLAAMVQILEPGGVLVLSVPNRDSFLRHQYNLLDMPPHHMTRWNGGVLAYLSRLFPLRLLGLRFEPLAPYHISGYVAAYGEYWRAKVPFLGRPLSEERLGRLADFIRQRGLNRFLRGQSLYGVFQRL
jgi:SAM-dependent methyltransferase